jgi:hypothetical protein
MLVGWMDRLTQMDGWILDAFSISLFFSHSSEVVVGGNLSLFSKI